VHIARRVVGKVGPGGALLFIGGTGGRRPATGAPVRVNFIPPGFVDTPLSASLLGDQLACVASRSARRCRSGAWSVRPTSPRSPSTS